jgi:hypothetical protein
MQPERNSQINLRGTISEYEYLKKNEKAKLSKGCRVYVLVLALSPNLMVL